MRLRRMQKNVRMPIAAPYTQGRRRGRGGRGQRAGRLRRAARAAAQGLNAGLGRGGKREESVTDVVKEAAKAVRNRLRFRRPRA